MSQTWHFLIISITKLAQSRWFSSPWLQMWAPGSTDGCRVPRQPGRTSGAPFGWWPRTGAPPHHPAGGASKGRSYDQNSYFRFCKCFMRTCCVLLMKQTTIKLCDFKPLTVFFRLRCICGRWENLNSIEATDK